MEDEQRMSSSPSDLERLLDATVRRHTPSPAAAAAAAAPAGSGRLASNRAAAAAAKLRKDPQQARATAAFSSLLASARSLADQNLSRREELKRVKEAIRDIQSQLSEAVTLQVRRESKRTLATESISEATAKNEELRTKVADLREERDTRAEILSRESQASGSHEAGSSEDATGTDEKVPKFVLWYEKYLGFRVIGEEEGATFVFNKIDPQHPEKEYSFRVSPDLEFMECDPHVKEIEDLAKDLDLNVHFYKFVSLARQKFLSFILNGTTPVSPVVGSDVAASPLPSPGPAAPLPSPVMSSEDAHNQTPSSSKKNVRLLPAKRGARTLSGPSPGVLRRSPRLEGTQGASS